MVRGKVTHYEKCTTELAYVHVIIDQGGLGWLLGMLPYSHEVVTFLVGAVISKVLLPGFMHFLPANQCLQNAVYVAVG